MTFKNLCLVMMGSVCMGFLSLVACFFIYFANHMNDLAETLKQAYYRDNYGTAFLIVGVGIPVAVFLLLLIDRKILKKG